ncbi:tetratricopeptide repeat protein [Micromonospora zamorensis]|uniref:tetratricopeptide repeat protein n=1 Tax=Micromonospora zamorensis TaxID=709883 RepID=UPI0033D5BBFD
MRRSVHLVTARGEEHLAERLTHPLQEAGFSVSHDGTIMVGESLIEEPAKLLATGVPVVLCATVRAVGSAWAHRLVNAAHASTTSRVYVVQIEEQAYVQHLSLDTKVARYDQDPQRAVAELVEALSVHFPPLETSSGHGSAGPATDHFLDQPTTETTFDLEALARFREQLRDEAKTAYPESLSPHDFLDIANLTSDASLTRAGLLLFGGRPEKVLPTAIIQCARYHGRDRTTPRDIVRITGPLVDQIISAWQFVADRVSLGETTTRRGVQAAPVYRYPMMAVRELIANAVVHRRYENVESCVHVRLFTDRLEITSAGEWVGRQVGDDTTNDLAELEGESRSRNFRLAQMLAAVRLFEGEGSGIPTTVADCHAYGAPEPKVIQRADSVTVVLRPRADIRQEWMKNGQADTASEVVPQQLPASVSTFVGRSSELMHLSSLLSAQDDGSRPTAALCVIIGAPGVGKTALALQWAHQAQHLFPDGQLYLNLRGFGPGTPCTPVEALSALLDSLGIRKERIPVDVEAQASLFRSVLGGRRMLLVLDNAASAAQVRPLLPASATCTTLITSRHSLAGLTVSAGAPSLTLDPLPFDDALALLGRHVGSHRIETDREAAATLVGLCAGLPLALGIVASRAATRPELRLSDLVAELTDRAHLLDGLDAGDDAVNVRVVFSWSYQRLSPEAAALFRRISLHPGPDLDTYAAANLAGEDLSQTRTMLNELAQAHFLNWREAGRFGLHDLLQLYGHERAQTEDDLEQRELVVHRMLDYYVRTTVLADRHLDDSWEAIDPDPAAYEIVYPHLADYNQAFDWLSIERPTLLAVTRYAAQHQDFGKYAWQIAWALTTFLYRHGYWHDWAAVNETALSALRRHGDAHSQARAHRILGSAYARLERYDEAAGHQEEALTLFRQLADVDGQAHSHLMLGRCYAWQSRYADALVHAKQALTIYRESGNRTWEARSLTDVGRVFGYLGDNEQSIQLCQIALSLCRETGDDDGQAAALHTLGRALVRLGRHSDAVARLREAVRLRTRLADQYEEAETLIDLGDGLHELQDTAAARNAWQSALDILRQLQHSAAEDVQIRLAAVGSGITAR